MEKAKIVGKVVSTLRISSVGYKKTGSSENTIKNKNVAVENAPPTINVDIGTKRSLEIGFNSEFSWTSAFGKKGFTAFFLILLEIGFAHSLGVPMKLEP